jgi:hypothetical protein
LLVGVDTNGSKFVLKKRDGLSTTMLARNGTVKDGEMFYFEKKMKFKRK